MAAGAVTASTSAARPGGSARLRPRWLAASRVAREGDQPDGGGRVRQRESGVILKGKAGICGRKRRVVGFDDAAKDFLAWATVEMRRRCYLFGGPTPKPGKAPYEDCASLRDSCAGLSPGHPCGRIADRFGDGLNSATAGSAGLQAAQDGPRRAWPDPLCTVQPGPAARS